MRAARGSCIAILLFAALGMSSVAHAEWVIGRYAGEFLSLGAGARALAMGDASVAAPTPSSAAYYNPAALAGIEKRYVEFMHASQFDNLFAYDYLSLAGKLRGGQCAAVTVLYTRVSDIPLTTLADPNRPLSDDNRVVVKSKTGDHELALMAAAAKPLGNWKAGVTAKLLFKTVAGESAYGLGFDAGVKRSVLKNVEVGAALRDATSSVLAWSTGRTETLLPSLAVGGAWSAELKSLNARLSLAADLDGHFESRGEAETIEAGPLTVEPHVGLEYLISHTVALRGGINGNDLTAGAGINFAWLSVHAAFQDHADLGLTHRISVAVAW